MTNLISGKEAKLAWANGEKVEYYKDDRDEWFEVRGNTFVSVFDTMDNFRLKPRTITLNGIEVPAPFEPKEGERYFYLNPQADSGYGSNTTVKWSKYMQFGTWRTEEEIKQVIAALHQIFGGV